jgi:DNA repair exonuclease SbcCD ATPase subunit
MSTTNNIPNIPRLSFEEVWSITQESARLIQEINKTMQENAKQTQEKQQESETKIEELRRLQKQTFEEIKQTQKQTNEQIKKTGEHLRQTDEQFKKTFEEIKQAQKQTDEQIKQTDEQIKKTDEHLRQTDEQFKKTFEEIKQAQKQTDEQIKKTGEQLGNLGNRFGEMEEYLVAPGIAEKFNELNYHFSAASRNIKLYDENEQKLAEIDIMLENDDFILCVEVKMTPNEKDLRKHINRLKIVQCYFKDRRPKERKIIGAIAGTVFDEKFKNIVIENGLYAILPTGNTFKIDVPEGFQPKIFRSES